MKIILNQQDCFGRTAFFYACYIGNLELIKILIQKKYNLNLEDDLCRNIFHYIAIKGTAEIMNYVIEYAKKVTKYQGLSAAYDKMHEENVKKNSNMNLNNFLTVPDQDPQFFMRRSFQTQKNSEDFGSLFTNQQSVRYITIITFLD